MFSENTLKSPTTSISIICSIYIYFKNIWGLSFGEACSQECPRMLTGPVGPIEVIFYWPKTLLFFILLARGQQLTASIEACVQKRRTSPTYQMTALISSVK